MAAVALLTLTSTLALRPALVSRPPNLPAIARCPPPLLAASPPPRSPLLNPEVSLGVGVAILLLLVTNRQSNILEDMDTLRLLGKVVPEYVVALDEEGVMDGAFELIFAFDEVISMGHKEHTNVQQVAVNLDMESHEERLHKMIIQSKIDETKDHMKRKAMEIDKVKMEAKMEAASKMHDQC